jgi:hypothetical protein
MSDEGFDDRRKAGEARIAQRNAEELGQTLEGPGSEERLERLKGRFKALDTEGRKQARTSTLVLLGFAVFLTIVFFGVGRVLVENIANEIAQGR